MINIPIFSTFKNAGFKAAERSMLGLNRGFQRLGITIAGALSVRQITRFGKAAVQAFTQDNKAASALAQTMNNLGMAFQSPAIEDFIKRLSQTAAVADDVLRPALGDLLRATRNLGKSQEVLNLALDISAATGKDLRTVTTALSRAYLGNNASLGRLNAGLSKAFLATASFEEVQGKLEEMFAGSSQKAAATYAGQLEKLRIASEEAKEMIGQSLVQSIELLGQSQGIDKAQKKMEGFGRATSDVILGFSVLAKNVTGGADGKKGIFGNFVELVGDLTRVNQLLADTRTLAAQARVELLEPVQRQSIRAIENESAASLKRWLKEQNALKKIRNEQERIAKASKAAREEAERRRKILEKLTKAGEILDTERANIEAALKNKSLDENERLRLELKKAILTENADEALKLSNDLEKSQNRLAKLREISDSFKPANPFQPWLDAIDELNRKISLLGNVTAPTVAQGDAAASLISLGERTGNQGILDQGVKMLSDWINQGNDAATLAESLAERSGIEADIRGREVEQQVINLNMNISNLSGDLPPETKKQIVDTVVEASSYGLATGWFRTVGVTPA